MAAVRHAASELGHAEAFRRAARATGLTPIVNLEAQGWRDIRRVFAEYADKRDLLACLIIQEVMLESFAVALYKAMSEIADPELASVFRSVSNDEAGHVAHAVDELQGAFRADPDGFEAKAGRLNDEVMYYLAHMVAARDNTGPCGLCQGHCLKESISTVGLERTELRGRAINKYLQTLDAIGVRGERSLSWVARLPL
jgi:fatty aldehyde decarbonylase